MISKAMKKDFISSLTERERVVLVGMLAKVTKPLRSIEQVISASEYLGGCETVTLFGFLHKQLFGQWSCDHEDLCKVLENLEKIRSILKDVPLDGSFPAQAKNEFVDFPVMPTGLQITNEMAKDVFVTIHAWKQFCERWRLTKLAINEIVGMILRSFARAKPVSLPKSHKTRRFISNNLVPADYFLDKGLNCQFVVVQNGNHLVLQTVERPYSQ